MNLLTQEEFDKKYMKNDQEKLNEISVGMICRVKGDCVYRGFNFYGYGEDIHLKRGDRLRVLSLDFISRRIGVELLKDESTISSIKLEDLMK